MAFNKFIPVTVFDAELLELDIDGIKGQLFITDGEPEVILYKDGDNWKKKEDDEIYTPGNDEKITKKYKNIATLSSLKIANFTQEGPEKTARGGKNNAIIVRHGKTTRLEMEDAIINIEVLEALFGAKIGVEGGNSVIKITDSFPTELRIEGDTFFIDQETGNKETARFVVYRFFPDGLFNLTMEAEGDFGVLEIGGEVIANKCGDFYTITSGGKYNCKE